jgi:hypothetical protein
VSRPEIPETDVAGRIYKIEMRQASFEKFKASIEVIAIVLAGIWGFYQFIYEDKIKPFSETPSLTVTLKLEKLGTHGQWQAFRGTETIVNDSRIRVAILARTINMYGLNVVEKPKDGPFVLDSGTWNVNRAYRLDNPVLMQSHAVFFSGDSRGTEGRWWLQPGDTSTRSAIYFVKMVKYDVVPAFKPFVLPNADHILAPADRCGDVEESSACPITGVNANSALSLW